MYMVLFKPKMKQYCLVFVELEKIILDFNDFHAFEIYKTLAWD